MLKCRQRTENSKLDANSNSEASPLYAKKIRTSRDKKKPPKEKRGFLKNESDVSLRISMEIGIDRRIEREKLRYSSIIKRAKNKKK